MGMSIDESLEWLISRKEHYEMDDNCQELAQALDVAIDTMNKYQMLQADYNARLKADMVAMLTEIQLEIEELDTPNNSDAYMTCSEIIQQKIDKLKGKEDRKWIIK